MVADKCKVCGGDLNLSDSSFCPQCGFEHHILPEPVSDQIRKYEEKRINACKEVWEKHSLEIEKLQKTYDEGVYKNKTLEQELERAKKETLSAQQEKEQEKKKYEAKLKETGQSLEQLKKGNNNLVADIQKLMLQNESLKTELDNAKGKIEQLKQNPPASGAQLKIIEEYGKYRLYDVSGVVRRSNGTAIGKSGIELYDGYVFHIGDVSFKVSTPEFNFDNLNF